MVPDSANARSADKTLDATWSALFDVLNGWAKLTDHTHAGLAAKLLPQLFPEGLKFVQLAFKLEWAESNTRLFGNRAELRGSGSTTSSASRRRPSCAAMSALCRASTAP